MSRDTKLTSILFKEKVLNKLLDIDPFFPSSFSDTFLSHTTYWDTKVICHSHFLYLCWWFRHYLDVMVAMPKNATGQLLSVCLSQRWILYLIVNSCRVSYVNSDSHQMCTISLKYCYSHISFWKCLCHFLWHFNSGIFNTEKLYSPIFRSEKLLFLIFNEERNKHCKLVFHYDHHSRLEWFLNVILISVLMLNHSYCRKW